MTEIPDDPTEHGEESEPAPTGWVQIPVLRGVFEIEPLFNLCDSIGGLIIGGYARYCCSVRDNPDKAGDVDIFPVGNTEEESTGVYNGWVGRLTEAGLKIKHENNVSVTYEKAEQPPFNRCPVIQLIKPVREGAIVTWGTVVEILENFDFTVVRVALNKDRRTATAWASFSEDEQFKRLRILNIHCPISSLLRVCKYARKGYWIRPVESLKLFADWEQRSTEYRERMHEMFAASQIKKLSREEIDELEALLRVD